MTARASHTDSQGEGKRERESAAGAEGGCQPGTKAERRETKEGRKSPLLTTCELKKNVVRYPTML